MLNGAGEFVANYKGRHTRKTVRLKAVELLKTITSKVVGGAVLLAVAAGGISWWRMDEASHRMLLSGTAKITAWLGVVALLPWVTFFFTTAVTRAESNMAGGLVVAGYTVAETALVAWLFGWRIAGPAGWTFLLAGMLLAGVYNLLVCDWIAERFG
jgi:hypothetical protein